MRSKNKKKWITFVGKLNKAKGYDVFCKALFDITGISRLVWLTWEIVFKSLEIFDATFSQHWIVTNIIKKMIKFKSNLILDFLYFKSRISQNNRNKISKLFPKWIANLYWDTSGLSINPDLTIHQPINAWRLPKVPERKQCNI